MSLSDYLENKLLDHLTGRAAFTMPSGFYIKLHVGEPGENGTSNAATDTTRKAITFAAAASGSIASNADGSWADYDAGGAGLTETLTHWSGWDADPAGNCLVTGALGGGAPQPCTAATSDIVTCPAHGMADGDRVEFFAEAGGAIATGLSAGTLYFVRDSATDTFKVALTSGGAAVDVTASGKMVLRKVVPKIVNDGDVVTVSSGQLTVTLD